MMFKCDLRRAENMACCLRYNSDVAPKNVQVMVVAIKTKRTIDFVNWSPIHMFSVKVDSGIEVDTRLALQRHMCNRGNVGPRSAGVNRHGVSWKPLFARRVHWVRREWRE